MTTVEISSCLCLILYALATVCSLAGVLGRSETTKRTALLLCTAGLALQTAWIIAAACSGAFATAPRGFYLLPLSWLPAAAVVACARKYRLEYVAHFAAPWSFFLCSIALGLSGHQEEMPIAGPLFLIHLIMIFIGVGVMAIAAASGTLFLIQERALKGRAPVSTMKSGLPSLAMLDKVNALATLVGFPAYSLGLLCGFLWARVTWNGTGSDAKEWISLLILLIYALLFHQRQALAWQGRKPAILAIVIFAASLFSMLVVNTLFSVQHGF